MADPELEYLVTLDEESLLMEIAMADDPHLALHAPDDLIDYGRAAVARVLPQARALICPHHSSIKGLLSSPEFEVITTVAAYLVAGLAGALVKPLATYLVKRGIEPLCANWKSNASG
jgi:hypothetical protein